MKPHVKLYISNFNYDIGDFIPCENCGAASVDVHHIDKRGMGGSKTKDYIENLAALCRECHIEADNNKEFNEKVKAKHLNLLEYFNKK